MNGRPRFAPDFEQPRRQQGVRLHARNTFAQRTRLAGPDGTERDLREAVSEEAVLTEGDVGRGLEVNTQTLIPLDCGHVFDDSMKLMQTPAGFTVCDKHHYACGRCGHIIEPVPPGEAVYLRQPFDRAYHRRCCLELLRSIDLDLRLGRDLGIPPEALLHLRQTYRQLQQEFPGPVSRLWRRLTG